MLEYLYYKEPLLCSRFVESALLLTKKNLRKAVCHRETQSFYP